MSSTVMTYGAYPFSPVPFMRLGRSANKTGSGEIIGFTWSVSLSGDLVASPSGSIVNIDAQQDALMSGLAEQGKLFYVACDGNTILSVYPKIDSVNFEQGTWVNRSPYTVEMEFDTLPSGQVDYISDYSEDWSFEFVDEKTAYEWTLPGGSTDALPHQARITHSVSATGKRVFDSGGLIREPYQYARRFVTSRLGLDNEYVSNSGVINLLPANFNAYNHFRTVNANESAGSYSVNENWILISNPTGLAGRATEDFTISVRTQQDSPIRTVSIEGSIQGLESRSYGSVPGDFTVTERKYDAAEDYWVIVKDRLLGRCNLILDTVSTVRDLNIRPISTSVGHNPYNGTISYSYEFNDRPSNCLTDAIFESITVNDNNPADVFATIFVLGRANGPVLQNLNTKTLGTRSVQIEATYEPPSGCPTSTGGIDTWLSYQVKSPGQTDAEDIINAFEDHLEASYDQVFRSEDSQSWTPKDGRFSRSVTWSYGVC